jgi:autotransporter-associated beta strand protein
LGTGTFTQSGGTNSTYTLYLGYNSTGKGTYNLNAGTLSGYGLAEYIGNSGSGTLNQSGGTNNPSDGMFLGFGPGVGTYNLNAGTLSAGGEYVGFSGMGVFTQSGGTNSASYNLCLGYASTGQGTYNLNAGTLSGYGLTEYIGDSGSGTLTQSGGTNTVYAGGSFCASGSLYLGCTSTGSGTYNLNGGTLITPAVSKGPGTAAFNFGGGTLQASGALTTSLPMTLTGTCGNANVNTSGYAVTLSGILSGPGGLNKLGAGTLTLTGANSYMGLTTVQAGTLWLGTKAQNPIFSLGGVDIQGGSLVLAYSGTSPAATVASILTAGYQQSLAAGSGQIFSSTAAADGLTLGWSDNGSGAVTIMATVPGDANLDGRVDINDLTIVLTHYGATGAVWSQGDFTYDGRVDVNDLTIVLANYGQTLAGSSPALSPVPEPSAFLLLSAALLALLARVGWKRR